MFRVKSITQLCAGDLAAAQAAGADVNMLGSSVHDGLDALHIGFPGAVGPSVRVGNLDAERHILVAKLTFNMLKNSYIMIPESSAECKKNFQSGKKLLNCPAKAGGAIAKTGEIG